MLLREKVNIFLTVHSRHSDQVKVVTRMIFGGSYPKSWTRASVLVTAEVSFIFSPASLGEFLGTDASGIAKQSSRS